MATAARAKTARGASRGDTSLPPLVVRYPRRMKLRKTYTVQVNWKSPPRAGDSPPITVRLVMAGAQVVPSERLLDPENPKDKAVFFLTPLAKGWLKGERLEVLHEGRKVQELALPAKAVTQRKTWSLFGLMLLVPWLLFQLHGVSQTVKTQPWEKTVAANTPVPLVEEATMDWSSEDDWLGRMGVQQKDVKTTWDTIRAGYFLAFNALANDEAPTFRELSREAKEPDDGEKKDDKDDKGKPKQQKQPPAGGAAAVPPLPPLPKAPGGKGDKTKPALDDKGNPIPPGPEAGVQGEPGQANVARASRQRSSVVHLYLPFWSAVVFLVLGIISAWIHRDIRRKRVSRPISLFGGEG